MILVFGGTTEGRRAAEVLEEAGSVYFYSTKTGEQELTLHSGQRIDGAMDEEAMYAFCQEHSIRLMVDAAHPFASQLHATIAKVAESLQIPVVRLPHTFLLIPHYWQRQVYRASVSSSSWKCRV